MPIAVLAVRFPSKLSASLERLTYVGYALPGIVVALSLVFFGARYAPWLYQTRAMLVFAYAVLFCRKRWAMCGRRSCRSIRIWKRRRGVLEEVARGRS